jgi:hypothetical protein
MTPGSVATGAGASFGKSDAMRLIATVIFFLALCVGATAQSAGWRQFSVPETGTNVDFPASIFAKDAGPPETGFGRRFTTADGRATLAVQSMTNAANDSPAAFLAKKHPPSNIAYSRITSRFFVVSSFRNRTIWYDRCNFVASKINCVFINYPAIEKRQWDDVVTRISHSLSGI